MLRYLSGITIAIALAFTATTSSAENWGIRFDQMPVGTEIEFKSQTGDRAVIKYIGRKGKFYVVERTNLQTNRKYREKYNAKGHKVSVHGRAGAKGKLSPHDCYMVLGTCSHAMRGHRTASGKYIFNVKKISATKRVGWGPGGVLTPRKLGSSATLSESTTSSSIQNTNVVVGRFSKK